ADEAVVADVELRPQVGEGRGHGIHLFLRGDTPLGGDAFDIDAVLVGAGQQEDVVTAQAVIAGDRIGGDGGVGVANVGYVIGVIDGRGQVIGGHSSGPRCRKLERSVGGQQNAPHTAGPLV